MKKLYILLSIGLLLFLVIQYPHSMVNPGELIKGHQKLNNECLSCHKPFGGIANEKCVLCHKLSDIGKDTTGKANKTLFHDHLSKTACSSCHTEHQGVTPENTLKGFTHELLSETIKNNCTVCHTKPADKLHTQVLTDCNSCHQTQSWKRSISFNHDVLLNKMDCSSCHQKPKDNYHSLIKENCEKCHSTSKWVPSTFDHSAYFQLDQNHTATCTTCHITNNYSSFTCYGCHEHSEGNTIAKHNEEGIYTISDCASCHKSGNEHDMKDNNGNQIHDATQSNDRKEKDDD